MDLIPGAKKGSVGWEDLRSSVRVVNSCLIAKSFLTLCDSMDCSLPGSSVRGTSQARIPEWVTIPSPGDLPSPGIEPASPALTGRLFTNEPPGKPKCKILTYKNNYLYTCYTGIYYIVYLKSIYK